MSKLKLSKVDPSAHESCKDKEEALKKTAVLQKKMYDLLYLMFAHNKYSLLIVLHGIDASGKDGSVRHIFSGANPQGLKSISFKKPTDEECRHDFLWRCHKHTPESGAAVIFNRSYYEEVTTVKVHPELLQAQHIPDEILRKKDFFEERYDRINEFEKLLVQKGTIVLKFFLHISKNEQKARFHERFEDSRKNWKFTKEDIEERKHWSKYQKVFDEMFKKTNTSYAPWTIVPANNKWYRDLVLSQTIVDHLESLKMSFPKPKVNIQAK